MVPLLFMKCFNSILILIVCLFSSIEITAEQFIVPPKLGSCTLADAKSVRNFNLHDYIPSLRNEDLYIGVKTVLDLYNNNQKNQLALVDVREAEEYEKYRIPNTLNIQAHLLKYKSYLKSKTLVLVNSGKQYKELESTVAELRLQGYKNVSILDGGLRKWHKEANRFDGKASAAKYLNTISVKEFLAESSHGPWLVFDLNKKETFKAKINGKVVHLPYDAVFALNLSSKLNEVDDLGLTRILFTSNDKELFAKLVPILDEKGISNYHILSEITDYIQVFNQETRKASIAKDRVIKGCAFK